MLSLLNHLSSPSREYAIVFGIYILIIFVIAYYATRQTRTLSDYVLGGRKLSGPIAALGAGASDMSSWLLMALPGAIYVSGLSNIWLPIGLILGAFANWHWMGQRLRIQSEQANNALTIPAYLSARFSEHAIGIRIITASVIIIFFTAYATAGFMSGAKLAQATFGWDYHYALLISGSVIIAYTTVGGFLAVNWIDFFQGCLMFLALCIVPIAVLNQLAPYYFSADWLEFKNLSDLFKINLTDWPTRISLLAWGLGYFGQPHILSRFMAIRSPDAIPGAMRICMTWMILALVGAVLTGLFGKIYFASHGQILSEPETIFLKLSEILFNPWMTGFLFAAVLSAIMSTIAAQLLAASSSVIEDFYHTFFRKNSSQFEYLILSRFVVLILSGLALCGAWEPNRQIMDVVDYSWSGLGASFGPVILMSLYWKKMPARAAVWGLLTGAGVVIGLDLIQHIWGIRSPFGVLLPGFLANCFVIARVKDYT